MYLNTEQIEKDILNVQKIKCNSKVRLLSYISDRAGRKSSAIQERLIDRAIEGHPAIVIRDKSNRPITEHWFSKYELDIIRKNGWKLYTEDIKQYKGGLSCVKMCTDSENSEENTFILFYGMFLSLADIYKSNFYDGWNDVEDIIWEECIPKKALVQNEKYVIDRCMSQMIDLMSICSTVARDKAVNCFLLGNDLSYNIINPVTVSFRVLERLKINKTITDTCMIDDIEYPFLFRYFDFPNSTNHWLIDKSNKVDATIDITDLSMLPYSFSTEFNRYYVYYYKNTLYISDRRNQKNEIRCLKQLIEHLGYQPSSIISHDIQLQCIRRMDEEADYFCRQFFDGHGRFIPQVQEEIPDIYLPDVLKMKKHIFEEKEIHNNLFQLCKKTVLDDNLIYCNMYIKILLQKIFYLFR